MRFIIDTFGVLAIAMFLVTMILCIGGIVAAWPRKARRGGMRPEVTGQFV